MTSLTNNAVRTMVSMEGSKSDPSFQPVMQILNFKLVSKPGAQDRYRAVLSDGTHFVQGLISSQLNALALEGSLASNKIVKIMDFMNNVVQGRTVMIIIKLEVIPTPPDQDRIGAPKEIDASLCTGGGGQQQQQQGQPLYNTTNVNNSMNNNNFGGNNPAVVKTENNNRFNNNQYGGNNNQNNSNNQFGGGGSQNNNSNPYNRNSNNQNTNNPYTSPNRSNNANNPYSGGRFQANTNIASSAPIVRSNPFGGGGGGQHITPIASLNMYQNRWTIKARVTNKGNIRTWSNAKGEGSLFNIELLDSTGDIRATFFKEAVDKWYNVIQEGQVYSLSGGRLKVANAQYNTCKSQYEINFDANSEISLQNDAGDISQQNYDFCKIADVEEKQANQFVDLLAIVKAVAEPATIVSRKTGQELIKCELTLIDDSNSEVNLTLWGDKASRAPSEFHSQPVVAFRRARVSDYGGKTLSLSGSCDINPTQPDLQQAINGLRSWWNNGGSNSSSVKQLTATFGSGGKMDSLAERKTISAIKDEHLGQGGMNSMDGTGDNKPDWISFKATISFLKKDKEGGAWYPACANAGEPCKNRFKVTQTTDGQYYCDKCQASYPNCVHRWIFSGMVEDDTSSTWVSFFNEQAETLLDGAIADDIHQKVNVEQDQDVYNSIFSKAVYTDWIFKCKVKMEMVNDESRVKTSVYALHPMDYVKESRDMLDAIDKF